VAAEEERAPEEVVAEEDFVDLREEDVARAVTRAALIPRRITPHALAIPAAEESEPERRMDRAGESPRGVVQPGILYGTWWHEFVQSVAWEKPRETWQERFISAVESSPQRERSVREWGLFCQSELAAWLAEPGRAIHREIPFLWREVEGICLEGVIDLAVYTPGDGSWEVIDWKTNRPGRGGSGELVETYRGQVEAYVRALGRLLATEVKGSLYFTATGEWRRFV